MSQNNMQPVGKSYSYSYSSSSTSTSRNGAAPEITSQVSETSSSGDLPPGSFGMAGLGGGQPLSSLPFDEEFEKLRQSVLTGEAYQSPTIRLNSTQGQQAIGPQDSPATITRTFSSSARSSSSHQGSPAPSSNLFNTGSPARSSPVPQGSNIQISAGSPLTLGMQLSPDSGISGGSPARSATSPRSQSSQGKGAHT